VSLYHLDRDGTLLAKHASPKEPPKHEDGGDAASANLTLTTHPLNAANFDYTHRVHPAGLFVAFCVPSDRHCQARPAAALPRAGARCAFPLRVVGRRGRPQLRCR
jgi:hypothetical protein